jgi:hypothetical protein
MVIASEPQLLTAAIAAKPALLSVSSARTFRGFGARTTRVSPRGGDPSVDGRDDLPGPRPGSSSRPRQAVLADELLSAHGQPRAGGGALHDEDGHPIGHLRPHEVGQHRDLVGRDVVRHQKNRAPS